MGSSAILTRREWSTLRTTWAVRPRKLRLSLTTKPVSPQPLTRPYFNSTSPQTFQTANWPTHNSQCPKSFSANSPNPQISPSPSSFTTNNTQKSNFPQPNSAHTFTPPHPPTARTKFATFVLTDPQDKKSVSRAGKITTSTKMAVLKHVPRATPHTPSIWLVSSVRPTVKAVSGCMITTVFSVKTQSWCLKMDCVWKSVHLGILKMGIVSVIMSVLIRDADCAVLLGSVTNAYQITLDNLLANGNSFYLHFSWVSLPPPSLSTHWSQQELSFSWKEQSQWPTKSSSHSRYSNLCHGSSSSLHFTPNNKLCSSLHLLFWESFWVSLPMKLITRNKSTPISESTKKKAYLRKRNPHKKKTNLTEIPMDRCILMRIGNHV